MKFLRLALPALAFVAAGSWATHASACDDSKTTSARTAAGGKATTTAQYTSSSCSAKGASTASSHSCASKTSAAAYAASSNSSCVSKSTTSTSAYTASTTSKNTVAEGASCEAHKAKTMAISAGSSCSGRGMSTSAAKTAHGDCDACADMAMCYEELESAGTRTQVVPLKNGVMFVYTAESPGHVNAVQTAMARRNERLAQIVTAGDKAHLCPECKSIRGAMASGKMTREVVNIEGGALTLMTSNDPAVVARIHAMVESHKGGHSKI